ncbi:hypothetical protein OS493_005145 [Desmophyllum pertusum]|uniref:Uncharacterized protein n=1 Tax=Desmophyllum pertusum TaxID=174260 RepID=A0A9W9Z4F4_9CNID|nr:hypothetical protein OS493_005145 [Desmophyllum pertusum]
MQIHCIASIGSKTLASVLGAISLTTLTAISIDRLLALVLSVRLSYCGHHSTDCQSSGIAVAIWHYFNHSSVYLPMSFLYCMILLLVVCLTVTTLAYAKLLRMIHQHQTKIGADLQTTGPQSQEAAEISNIRQIQVFHSNCYLPGHFNDAVLFAVSCPEHCVGRSEIQR